MLTFKANAAKTLHAAHSGNVRVGYVEHSRLGTETDRWIWSLNTIQPKGGRASGIETSEEKAKTALGLAWVAWLIAAGLEVKR